MKPGPTLTFDNLGCSKGGRPLFKDLHCSVGAGHWLHIQGSNGAGKTSLLRMLCGLSPIESGDILWNHRPVRSQRQEFQKALSYLGHLNGMQESMTVRENLAFSTALQGHGCSSAAIAQALARFGIGNRSEQLVRHLSQGQKRRAALARLALSPTPLWVLDEPLVAMDAGGIDMLCELLEQHLHHGGIAVLTSHQAVPIGSVPVQTLQVTA